MHCRRRPLANLAARKREGMSAGSWPDDRCPRPGSGGELYRCCCDRRPAGRTWCSRDSPGSPAAVADALRSRSAAALRLSPEPHLASRPTGSALAARRARATRSARQDGKPGRARAAREVPVMVPGSRRGALSAAAGGADDPVSCPQACPWWSRTILMARRTRRRCRSVSAG